MIILIFLFIIILPIVIIYLKSLLFWGIPKGMTLFIGAPGSGKTTICAHFVKQFNKKRKYKGKQIFCNVPILHSLQFNPSDDMGQYLIEDGVCIVDEGGIEFNNRAFKTLPKSVINFAKLYRHYGITSFLFFSQGMDIDITFVRLCDRICIVRKSYIPYFICVKEVRKYIGIDELTHQLIDAYDFKFLGKHLIFAPTCWKYFDTYETPPLKKKTFYEWNNISRFTLDNSENGEISNSQNLFNPDEKNFSE